jgi:hypothetical protein
VGPEILTKSPLAIRCLKSAFNAELDGQAGIQELSGNATLLYHLSEEGDEGRAAWNENALRTSGNSLWLPKPGPRHRTRPEATRRKSSAPATSPSTALPARDVTPPASPRPSARGTPARLRHPAGSRHLHPQPPRGRRPARPRFGAPA